MNSVVPIVSRFVPLFSEEKLLSETPSTHQMITRFDLERKSDTQNCLNIRRNECKKEKMLFPKYIELNLAYKGEVL